MNLNRCLTGVFTVLLLTGFIGCTATGRGGFPPFRVDPAGESSLVIAPPIGAVSNNLTQSVFHHLDESLLRRRFQSVKLMEFENRDPAVETVVTERNITAEARRIFSDYTDARYVLLLHVNRFEVKEYTLTETRTLYSRRTIRATSTVTDDPEGGSSRDSKGPGPGPGRRVGPPEERGDGGDAESSYRSSRYDEITETEVPVARGQVRVVLSLSAVVYDQEAKEIVWSGQRIERLDDDVKNRSILELQDVVVERVMDRIMSRFTG